MDAQALLKLYRHISTPRHALPAMETQTWSLTTETQCLDSPVAAQTALNDFTSVAGWLGLQSATLIFRPGEALPTPDETAGVLLNAEAVNAAGHSLHLRYDSAGAWRLTRFSPAPGGDYLADSVKLVVHGAPGGWMHYRRFWRLDPAQGACPFAACFIGVVAR
jgi:hypothetical protein